MYTTILTFLIAVSIHAMSPRDPSMGWGTGWDAMGVAALVFIVVGTLFYLRAKFGGLARLTTTPEGADALTARLPGHTARAQAQLLLPFALLHYATPYPSSVIAPAEELSQTLGALAGVAPLLAGWLVTWAQAHRVHAATYPAEAGAAQGKMGRGEYVAAHAGLELPIIAPWFLISLVEDLFLWLWPGSLEVLTANPVLALLYAPLFILMAALLAPVLMTKLWRCTPLPPGPTRQLLERCAEEGGLKVREILVWPLMGGRLMTAGVIGLVPRFRYLMFTPGLMKALAPEELAAVTAHEAGHVRHGHLWTYLIFFAGCFVSALTLFFQGAELALSWSGVAYPDLFEAPHAATVVSALLTLGMIAIVLVGFRGIFGSVSRSFERQADLNALEGLGDAGPIIRAFEKIARLTGGERDIPSWHHGSIFERVGFLARAHADPALALAHHRRVRRLKTRLWAAVALLTAASISLSLPGIVDPLKLEILTDAVERRVEASPEADALWTLLGSMRFEGGDETGALAAMERAISLDTEEAEAYNAAAWIMCVTEDEALYDPHRAVDLARKALELTLAPHILDTLAEALYRTGDGDGALEAIGLALKLAGDGREDSPHYRHYLKQQARFSDAPDAFAP